MTIIGWLILGLITGFIAGKLVNKTGEGLVLGVVGTIVGGFLFSFFGAPPVTGLNIYSMVVAVVGAVVVLVTYHAVTGRSRSFN